MSNSVRRQIMKNWYAIEAIPIYTIIGGVMVGATWYMYRLATGPSIIWTKANPQPWNTIKQDENTKLMTVNQKLEKNWTRHRM